MLLCITAVIVNMQRSTEREDGDEVCKLPQGDDRDWELGVVHDREMAHVVSDARSVVELGGSTGAALSVAKRSRAAAVAHEVQTSEQKCRVSVS